MSTPFLCTVGTAVIKQKRSRADLEKTEKGGSFNGFAGLVCFPMPKLRFEWPQGVGIRGAITHSPLPPIP